MNIISKLSVRQLGKNKRRTLITVIGIVLSVALITAISGFIVSMQDGLIRSTKANSGDWHIAFNNVSNEVIEELEEDPQISTYFLKDEPQEDGTTQTVFYFRLANPSHTYDETALAIAEDHGLEAENIRGANTTLLAAEGYIANDDSHGYS